MAEKISDKPEPDEVRKHLLELVTVLRKWFQKWRSIFQNIEITELQIATYVEALGDFCVDELEDACAEATKLCEFFPTPAAIRNHAPLRSEREVERIREWMSPDIVHALPSPDGKQMELERRERQQKWIEEHTTVEPPPPPLVPPKPIEYVHRTIEQQLQELKRKGYLQ